MEAAPPTKVTPATPPPPSGLADVLSLRAQASLFLLLIAFLGFVGWKAWAPAARPTSPTLADHGRIDLNRADRTELMLLDGIGPELADRIVEYRRQHGPFDGLADVRKVGGIGPMTLERMRPRVTLSWGATTPKSPPIAEVSIEPASLAVLNEATKTESLPTLDPNRATLAELDTLPGIGPKLAQRIVDERAKSPFRQISDLRRVAGIGTKTLEKIAPRLRFGGEVDSRVQ